MSNGAAAKIGALTNSGAINGGRGSAGVANAKTGMITTLTNAAGGTISAGGGTFSFARTVIGVAGVANSGAITTMSNSGTIMRRRRDRILGPCRRRRRGVQLRHNQDF